MTNIPAALRSEIEAVVESANIQGRTGGPTMQRQVDAAVAALCAKVEALITCDCGSTVWECSRCANGFDFRVELNEEPKDGGDD
jgi:hypothetical protein